LSVISNASKHELSTFRGAQASFDDDDSPRELAKDCGNVEFFYDRVRTRRGFEQHFLPTGYITSGYYFKHQNVDFFIYLTSNRVVILRNLVSTAEFTIQSGIGTAGQIYYAQFLYTGGHLYYTVVDAKNIGIQQAMVWDGIFTNPATPAFHRPLLTSEVVVTVTETGSGVVTAGLHGVLLKTITKTGYNTKPGPIDLVFGAIFPTVIGATGGKQIRVQAAPVGTWPVWLDSIEILFTTVRNPNRYEIIANTMVSGLGGTGTVYDKTFNYSDSSLREINNAATDFMFLLSQDQSGAGPFNAKGVLQYGDRVLWIANYGNQDCFFPSEKANPQTITADQHLKTLPETAEISSACVQGEVLNILSPDGVWAFTDNGDIPVSWATPDSITSQTGISHIRHITTRRGPGPAFYANPTGLHMISGNQISEKPLSYYQRTVWENINWSNPAAIQLLDDHAMKRLIVIAPVNSIVSGIYPGLGQMTMVWSYAQGLSLEKINYSPYFISVNDWQISWVGMGKNTSSNVWELWMASFPVPSIASATFLMRQKSVEGGYTNMFTDPFGLGINSYYHTSQLPNNFSHQTHNWAGIAYRLRGNGNFSIALKPNNNVASLGLDVLALDTFDYTPPKFNLIDLQCENIALIIAGGSFAQEWFELIHLTAYYWPWLDQR
jgi:hypothetical protein